MASRFMKARVGQFESIMGSPETLRNLERESLKTVFLGSQDFEVTNWEVKHFQRDVTL